MLKASGRFIAKQPVDSTTLAGREISADSACAQDHDRQSGEPVPTLAAQAAAIATGNPGAFPNIV
jgi:hypothetical protein